MKPTLEHLAWEVEAWKAYAFAWSDVARARANGTSGKRLMKKVDAADRRLDELGPLAKSSAVLRVGGDACPCMSPHEEPGPHIDGCTYLASDDSKTGPFG